jgi:hypothetical protein
MTCSTSMQMYKNSQCREVIVSKVQTQLNIINFSNLEEFPESAQHLAPFKFHIFFHIESWSMHVTQIEEQGF